MTAGWRRGLLPLPHFPAAAGYWKGIDADMSASDIREIEYPEIAKKPGASNYRAFEITSERQTVGILYAHEPFMDDGSIGVHLSISRSSRGRIVPCGRVQVAQARHVIETHGLKWPEKYETNHFESGPFRGKGLHVWEI